jgi:hypothetical protein
MISEEKIGRIWMKAIVTWFEVISCHMTKRVGKPPKNLNQNSQPLG